MKNLDKVMAALAADKIPVIIAMHPTEGVAVVVGSVDPETATGTPMLQALQETAIERGALCDVLADPSQLADTIFNLAVQKFPSSSIAQTPGAGDILPGAGQMPSHVTVFSKGPR